MEQVTEARARITRYENLIIKAHQNGQAALEETLIKGQKRNIIESALAATGFNKFIGEDNVIKFYKECEKGLRLDWIENFTRDIPDQVIEQKNKADALKIFDNYVVLHYDPNKKAYKLTHEEIQKKKDPILFGVFQESDRLYFIGDWIDENCNLTFDQLTDKLAENAKIIAL
jgi:hypothetical protein